MSPLHYSRHITAILLAALALVSCSGDDTPAPASQGNAATSARTTAQEYQLLRTELKLAETEKPYLIINFAEKTLQLKLKGAVVWSYPLQVAENDPETFTSFIDHFQGSDHRLVRPLTETHLFAAQSQTPDSILAIISEVTKFRADLLQREKPQRFQMLWGDNLILEVFTDVKGKPRDKFRNAIVEVRQVLQLPFGQSFLSIKMDSVNALTLYRAAEPGLPTMIYPPVS